jgi:hypothetical protein
MRVACGSSADLMLQFPFERGDDGTKCYQKMKQRQRAYLGSMERKRDSTRRRDDVGQRRGGHRRGKREEAIGLT